MSVIHSFPSFLPRKEDRSLQPPQLRDMQAMQELVVALLGRGFGYGEPLLNSPPETEPAEPLEEDELHPVDLGVLPPDAFLLSPTRPPIDDVKHGDRKQIARSYTDLEWAIFRAWRPYLAICARSHVMLSPHAQRALPEGLERCRDIAFKQFGAGIYKELNDLQGRGFQPPPAPDMTAAFLLRVEELPGGGPGLIHSFGMDANASLAWAYRLARDWASLLDAPGFTMVEIRRAPVPGRATNLRWAMDWKIEPLIAHLV